MLEINNLSLEVGEFSLQDINFSVKDYTVVLGPTGSGKSLLVEVISGLRKIDSGSIILNNKNITNFDVNKRKIGVLLQDGALFPHMNVMENLKFPLKITKRQIDTDEIENLADEFGIFHLLNRTCQNLSGGEKQRIALLRTMLTKPDALLLDEPLTAIDPSKKYQMQIFLKYFKNKLNIPVIHVTHDFEEAYFLSDHIVVLNNGNVEQIGKPKDIFRHPKSLFVANFVQMENILKVKGIEEGQGIIGNSKIFCNIGKGEEKIFVIRADEIIIADRRFKSSARNFIKMNIKNIYDKGNQVLVELENNDMFLISAITRYSLERMVLKKREEVFAVFKVNSMHSLL